jgi:hypothetical protein
MSSNIMRLCCSWFWNVSWRSLVNFLLRSLRSFCKWKKNQ